MRLTKNITIPTLEFLLLKPAGHHLMLLGATREIKTGETLKAVFIINGKQASFDFKVISR